ELEKIPASRFAIEQIIHHLELIENTPRDTQNFTLKTNAVLGLLPLKKRISQTQSIIEQGYTCLKCKISSDTFDNDLEYLNELFKLIPPEIQIRLDANGSFNKDNAQQALKQLEKFPIEYIEDICTDSDDIIMLSKQTKNSLAIDKGINTSDNMAYFMDNSSISTFIYKPVSAGGFFELKKFLSQAGSKNAKIIISSSFEHPLGLEYLKVMASYLELPGPHGLAVSKFYDYSSPISEKPEEHYDQKIYLENIQKLKINCKGEYSFA
ncbi:MAG: hypothetical protein KAI81_00430, partial [Candidatus Marinimicrobia bacterium]|nr:hypothetical protein [Candidatus Neomarinimicrobiota bacterium]